MRGEKMCSDFQDSVSNIQHRPSAFILAKGSKLLDTSAFLGFMTDHHRAHNMWQ